MALSRRLLMIGTLALTASLGACDEATAKLFGTYLLMSINGDPLPVLLYDTGTVMAEITDGSLTLNSDGTVEETQTWRTTDTSGSTTEEFSQTGTFERDGDDVTLTSDNPSDDPIVATLNGNQISVDFGDPMFPWVFLYER